MAATARETWPILLAVVLGTFACAASVQLTGPAWFKGFAAGVLITLGLGSVPVILLLSSESAVSRIQGADAERLTAEALGRRRWRRQGWHVVNGLVAGRHEVDHVAIGPGGVLALETKWCGTGTWRLDADGLTGYVGRDPIEQARASARKAASLLRSTNEGPALSLPVQPVVVLWGPNAPPAGDEPAMIDGVVVIHGGVTSHWQALLVSGRVTNDQAVSAASKLRAIGKRQWEVQRRLM